MYRNWLPNTAFTPTSYTSGVIRPCKPFPRCFPTSQHVSKPPKTSKDVAHERQVQRLYAQIGKLTTQLAQLEWLKKKVGLLDPDEGRYDE